MIEQMKQNIKEDLSKHLNLDSNQIVIESPKKSNADLAIPLFSYAKLFAKSPVEIFNEFKIVLEKNPEVDRIVFVAGFLNIYLKRETFSQAVLKEINQKNVEFGSQPSNNKTVIIDYSSPNIAKSFSVGHLRSTMIGHALKKLYQKAGYKVIGINHLGDWGTQFGRMIVAYKKWGVKEKIEKNPITELQKLYIKFHEALETDESLDQQGKDAFLKLEQNYPEYIQLWQWFRDESLKEFMQMYDLLKVDFDSYDGEAFYNDKMDAVVEALEKKELLKEDQGAMVVYLDDNLPPALIKRTDGATLYITRDLAALFYRFETYHFDKILYVVGNEQKLHFNQLKKVSQLLGYQFDLEHVNFGLVLADGKKMSTRGGNTKKLADVISEAIKEAETAITEKNPTLDNKYLAAQAVGIGAIIFNDLKNERHLDVDFNLTNMLKFEGQTGPYLQYSIVRIYSILRQASLDEDQVDFSYFKEDAYFELVKLLDQFPDVILRSIEKNTPSTLARYLLQLAQEFNSFYGKYKINAEDAGLRNTNLYLVKHIKTVLEEGLNLLGISTLEAM